MARRVLLEFSAGLNADLNRTLKRFSLLQAQGDSEAKRVAAGLRSALATSAGCDAEALRAGLHILLDSDLRSSLHDLEHATLVIHGANDALVPLAAAEYLASTLPRGKLFVVAGAAHAPFLSRTRAVASALQEFLA